MVNVCVYPLTSKLKNKEKIDIIKVYAPATSKPVFEKFSSKMCGVDKDNWWASKYATTAKANNGIGQYLQEY